LWSDPSPFVDKFGASERGISCTFGKGAIDEFLEKNDFDLLVRAHQVVAEGLFIFILHIFF
jgi:serine/threonine-protein phosphatase PP1 catalytic subunit